MNLELGAFKAVTHDEEHGEVAAAARSYHVLKGASGGTCSRRAWARIAGSFPMARLWISGHWSTEARLTSARATDTAKGRMETTSVQALDFTYRRFPDRTVAGFFSLSGSSTAELTLSAGQESTPETGITASWISPGPLLRVRNPVRQLQIRLAPRRLGKRHLIYLDQSNV